MALLTEQMDHSYIRPPPFFFFFVNRRANALKDTLRVSEGEENFIRKEIVKRIKY